MPALVPEQYSAVLDACAAEGQDANVDTILLMGALAAGVAAMSTPRHALHGGPLYLGHGDGMSGLPPADVLGQGRDHRLGYMTKGETVSRRRIFLES